MKTILVLTDFSVRADHAARYALKIAQQIKVNLLLCNVFLVPSSTGMASQVAWPMENFNELEEDCESDLREFVGRLNNHLDDELSTEATFRPQINYSSKAGFVANSIGEITSEHNVVMVVIGMHDHRGITSFLMGNHVKDIIEKATCPVLLVPAESKFTDFKKIGFATDLTHTDIEVLHSLSGFARYYNAEILLTHISEESDALQAIDPRVKIFLTMVSSKIDYRKIYYRSVQGKAITTSLDWIAQHIDIDLLVMVHRKKGFLQRIFSGSVTQKMADHLTKPLLVFPCITLKSALPVF
jgi:nucleotide-binding universal stress UspA family protein